MYHIYTGYKFRPMTEDELKIMNPAAILSEVREPSYAGDIIWVEAEE